MKTKGTGNKPNAPDAEAVALKKGRPADIEAEKVVLSACMNNKTDRAKSFAVLDVSDFSTEKHRQIWLRMRELEDEGAEVRPVTLAGALMRRGQLESIGGLSYLMEIDGQRVSGILNIDTYVRQVENTSAYNRIIDTCQETMLRCLNQDAEPLKIIGDLEQKNAALLMKIGRDGRVRTTNQVLDEFEGGIEAFIDPSKRKKGVPTGFTRLDEMLNGGLHEGKLYVVAGHTSSGKSLFAKDVAYSVAEAEHGVYFSSQEMEAHENLERALIARVNQPGEPTVWLGEFLRGEVSESPSIRSRLLDTVAGMVPLPIYWDDTAGVTYQDLANRIMPLAIAGKIKVAVIDYLQIMDTEAETKFRGNEVQAISHITRSLKRLARRLKIAIILLSQFSREASRRKGIKGGDPRPQLSDLKGSSSVEQDADAVIFPYRPDQDQPNRAGLKGRAELLLRKQRGGPTGVVDVKFEGGKARFRNLTEEEQAQVDAERRAEQGVNE